MRCALPPGERVRQSQAGLEGNKEAKGFFLLKNFFFLIFFFFKFVNKFP